MTPDRLTSPLATAYLLPPYRDGSALVAALWLSSLDEPGIALTAAPDRYRHHDPSTLPLAPRLLDRVSFTPTAPPEDERSVVEYAYWVQDSAAGRLSTGPAGGRIRSAVTSAHAAFAGALVKRAAASTHWHAFLPQPLTDTPKPRVGGDGDGSAMTAAMVASLGLDRADLEPAGLDLRELAELAVLAGADRIDVPTSAQRASLLQRWEATVPGLSRRLEVWRPPAATATPHLGRVPDDARAVPLLYVDDGAGPAPLDPVLQAMSLLERAPQQEPLLRILTEKPVPWEAWATSAQVEIRLASDAGDRLAWRARSSALLLLEPPAASGQPATRLPWPWWETGTAATVAVGTRHGVLAQFLGTDVIPAGHPTALAQAVARVLARR